MLKQEWQVYGIQRPRREKKLPVVLSVEEVHRVLGCVQQPAHRVCLSLIYPCGLRLLEGTHLQVKDIDSSRMLVHVRGGKGSKDRYVPLPQATLTLRREHWTTHRHRQWLFPGMLKVGQAWASVEKAVDERQELAADPRFGGGQIGVMGVLHTWTRALIFHPHVHFLVPAGALDFVNARWLHARNHFFVRVEPLAILFRAKFKEGLKETGLFHKAPSTAWQQNWVVHSKSVGYGVKALKYLADYVFRVGIANTRLVKLENDQVTFWYKDKQTKRRVYVTLPVCALIRRFLQHVLPHGFVKVRYYGFYAASHRHRLTLARELLAADHRHPQATQPSALTSGTDGDQVASLACPKCGLPMRCVQTLQPRSRAPP